MCDAGNAIEWKRNRNSEAMLLNILGFKFGKKQQENTTNYAEQSDLLTPKFEDSTPDNVSASGAYANSQYSLFDGDKICRRVW